MARRRAKTRTRTVRTVTRVAARRVKRAASRYGMSPTSVALTSVGYGFVRGDIANLASPLTSKLGNVGQISDELVLGTAYWFLAKRAGKGWKNIFMAGLGYEAGRAGELLRSGALFNSSSSQSNGVPVI